MDAKLNRNVPISVEREGDASGNRYRGFWAGNIGEKFLLLGGMPDLSIGVGDRLVVRMLLDTTVLGYKTTVSEILERPERLLIATWPEEVVTVELRKTERIALFVPTDVRAEQQKSSGPATMLLKAMMLNISSGGCYLSSKSAVEPDSQINVSFSLPGESFLHNLKGTVVATDAKEGAHGLRVKFAENAEDSPGNSGISDWVSQYSSFV